MRDCQHQDQTSASKPRMRALVRKNRGALTVEITHNTHMCLSIVFLFGIVWNKQLKNHLKKYNEIKHNIWCNKRTKVTLFSVICIAAVTLWTSSGLLLL